MVYYRLTADWADKDGRHAGGTLRVTHTWVRTAAGWQILGGMSSVEPNASK